MKTVHAPTGREPGFPADGIDLELYHFLCHKSPRLCSLLLDQCQHFCLYALIKCCTLITWSMVIFTLTKSSHASCISADLKALSQQMYGSKDAISLVSDLSPQHTETMDGFSSILCDAGTCVILCVVSKLSSPSSHLTIIVWLLWVGVHIYIYAAQFTPRLGYLLMTKGQTRLCTGLGWDSFHRNSSMVSHSAKS